MIDAQGEPAELLWCLFIENTTQFMQCSVEQYSVTNLFCQHIYSLISELFQVTKIENQLLSTALTKVAKSEVPAVRDELACSMTQIIACAAELAGNEILYHVFIIY